MPPLLKTGRGSPAGLLIYNDQHLPGFYRGWLYYPDVFRKLIRAYKVQPHGSTFKAVNEFEFLRSDDPLFRPCQMIAGPDGAIYIADWRTDSGGAGRLFGDGQHGRIYRVTWAGGAVPDSEKEIAGFDRRAMTSLADIVKKKDEELLDLLESVSALFADAARDELAQRGDKNRPALVKLVGDSNTKSRGRLRAIGALQSMWNDEVKAAFIQALGDLEPDIRRLAAEGLALNCAKGDREAHAALSKQIGDPDLPARRAILLAIGKINADNASEVVVEAYKFDDGKDVYLTDGIIRAIERTGKRGIQQLLAAARSGKDADREKVVAAFLTLRTPDGAEAIPELLADPHLSVDQRVAVIKSYSNYLFDPPVSMVPLTEFLTARPTETLAVQLAGFEVLADTGNLKGAKLANVLTALLDAPDDETRLGAIRAIEKGRTSEAAPRLIQVLGENGRSGAERVAIIKALRLLGDKASGTALKEILAATHPAALHLEALRSLAVIDPASTFAVAEKFLDFADAALRNEAVQILGTRPEGAKIIGQRFIDKKLPTELLPQVSEALRKHADKNPELKQMLTDVMKGGLLLSTQPGEIERIRQLVKTKGNAQRGKLIYLNSKQLACVTCHKLEGVGGQVGPDLTKVWETATIEKIMESIIEPSKEIKEGFQSFKATTKNGQTFTGLKAIDKPTEVVIRDANGKDITILRDNLEELNPSKVSLMPDNVVSQLSFDQFVDLVAFLKSKETQESLRGMVTEFLVVGPFGAKLEAQYGPEIESDAKLKYRDESTPPKMLSWEARSAEPNGFLNLRTIFNKDRASAYALTHVHSQKAQKAIIYVGADDSMRVWVNGKRVHEFANSRQAMPDNDRVEVDFKEGFNTVVIKVVNRSDEHGIFLRIKGEGLKFSARKE
jgi:putative heme-binding domain-containing protein